MRTTIAAVLVAASLAAPLAASAADVAIDTRLGATESAIRAALAEMGYEVRKIESENGKIEAYVVRDGRMLEVYVSAATGAVTKIETK